MILIISQDQHEPTTDTIIDWIEYFEHSFKRLNGIDFYRSISVQFGKNGYELKVLNIDWKRVKVIWLRRWMSSSNMGEIYLKNRGNNSTIATLNKYNREELKTLTSFFFQTLPKDKLFSAISVDEINKLIVLKKAIELNICIPETYIMTNVKSFVKQRKKSELITKSILNGISIKISGKEFAAYTEVVKGIPSGIKEKFAPSLFQQKIDKKYEIRSVLLSGKFYSMAIFSQRDKQTSIDFRKYNHDKPNRFVPIVLPRELELKLLLLSSHFGLNTGSFDLIKTKSNEYVFLEVNPGGQFEMVSYPCNYHLEKRFAEELIKTRKQ